jgi:SAM-dependent methyltransferase
MDIATLWQWCLSFEYDRQLLVEGLDTFLDRNHRFKILDCACGSGFPSLDLLRLGYDITCTDGSELMLEAFRKNALAAGISVAPRRIQWQDLAEIFPRQFDLVMCRGSSLIYAGAWENDVVPQRSAIREALMSFVGCLKPGGRLYVDTTSAANLEREEPERNIYPTRIIEGQALEFSETVSTNRAAQVRTWKSRVKFNGCQYEFTRHSHYLPHSELIDMLGGCGLRNVRRPWVKGEHYDIFVGDMPS